jgi:Co/Zn/Cd efflux system component
LGLILETSHVLLDKAAPEEIHSNITKAIEKDGDSRISDLHVWAIGPNLYGVIVSVVASNPKDAAQYKQMICSDARLAHVSIEVHKCQDPD